MGSHTPYGTRVSILVVVDLGQLPECSPPLLPKECCFNPCCRGSRSTAIGMFATPVGWILMFQSLLSWISVNCTRIAVSSAIRCTVSILVVVDLGQLPPKFRQARGRTQVSILVVVDLGQLPAPACGLRPSARCFNPCCRGSRSTAGRANLVAAAKSGFQSLLSWISVNCHVQEHRPEHRREVSILVVVDLGQLPFTTGIRRRRRPSFNPCCRGSRSTARTRKTGSKSRGCFNPCCRGSRSTAKPDWKLSSDSFWFQSLLSWISVNCIAAVICYHIRIFVSILVVVDLGQLLFSAILAAIPWTSFNPCCRGSRSTASPATLPPTPPLGFNPCCRGSRSTATRCNGPSRVCIEFQSLLSWISVNCLGIGDRASWAGTGFNPCCRGSRSTAAVGEQGELLQMNVSILVVVDLGQLRE